MLKIDRSCPNNRDHGSIKQQHVECWDSYAQTGRAYATKSGPQMAAVREMIELVSGF